MAAIQLPVITIDESVRSRWRGEAVLTVTAFVITEPQLDASFEIVVNQTVSALARSHESILHEPRFSRLRDTFRAMPDMDPARYRPASEALIRRFASKGFFRVHPLVDVNNLLSVRLRVPLGVYDLASLPERNWGYRIGLPSERYMTLGRQDRAAEGKLVLTDAAGVFGSPVADSDRALIRPDTREAAIIAFLPFDTSLREANEIVNEIETSLSRHVSPTFLRSEVVEAK